MASSLAKAALAGRTAELKARVGARNAGAARAPLVVRAQQQESSRRSALGLLAGAALLVRAPASEAAFGDAANVFGRRTNVSGFVPYAGDGYALLLPSKWNPSAEKDFPGVDLRYEDNGDSVNNVVVIKQKTDKRSIKDYGSAEDFVKSISYLLGKQVFAGETLSEGGFGPGRVSAASLLDLKEVEKKGKTYYEYEFLTRTADGDEGGRHHLIAATVGSDGNLYIAKIQAGDKRWFKGAKTTSIGTFNSFTVA